MDGTFCIFADNIIFYPDIFQPMIPALIFGFFNISGGEIFIIMIVVFLIFGPDKIPEIARWLGKGMGEIKKATSEIRDEISKETEDLKKEADAIKQGVKVENPLKKNPSSKTRQPASIEGDAEKENPENRKTDPHL